jgi:hypothetical protein
MKRILKILFTKAQRAFQKSTVAILCTLLIGFFITISCEEKEPTALNTTTSDNTALETTNDTTVVKVNFTTIAQGELNGHLQYLEDTCFTITTKEKWDSLKIEMNRIACFTETEIDFSMYLVISVFDVIHGNGGWTIDVIDVIEYSNKIEVSVSNLKKGNLTTVITHPFHIIKIPVSNKEIVFRKEE